MNLAALIGERCRICDASALHEFKRFQNLRRVTSDSREWGAGGRIAICTECCAVQKIVDSQWLADIDQIYESYVIYHQSGGKEQPIFSGGGTPPMPRSLALLNYFDANLQLPPASDVLDFGCGTGVALKTYAERHPDWRLYGAELSNQNLPKLREIPGFVQLFTCPPGEIQKHFNFITLIHALEHVLEPVTVLHDLRHRLSEDGYLFVEVPNGGVSAYDLVIADHLLHFSVGTLRFAAEIAGCDVIHVTDSILPKELSLLVRAGDARGSGARRTNVEDAAKYFEAQIDWLFDQIDSAVAISEKSKCFGIFGTSISATWLAGNLKDRFSFFVDEDPQRIGGEHMGRPVVGPSGVPPGSDVFVPLIQDVANSVVNRLSTSGLKFHAPPTSSESLEKIC